MKLNLRTLIVLAGLALLVAACEKDNDETKVVPDTTAPQVVSALKATAQNQKVLLEWGNPSDADFCKTVIVGNGKTIEVTKERTSAAVDGLTNGMEYSFEVYTIDNSGNKSSSVFATAKPDGYVTVLEGREFESGVYCQKGDPFSVEIKIDGSSYLRTLTNKQNEQFIWKGTVSKSNDTTYTFTYEYYTVSRMGTRHVANIENKINAMLCYSIADSSFYAEQVYEKIEGDARFIAGKYRSYAKSVSVDVPSYSDTTYTYLEFKADGSFSCVDSNYSDSDSWTNNDLIANNYLFVKLNGKTYLIDRKHCRVFGKKK